MSISSKNSKRWFATAQKMVEEGVVLLKNDKDILPLHNEKIAVFGYAQLEPGFNLVTKKDITAALRDNGCEIDENLYNRYKSEVKSDKQYRTNTPVTLIDREIKFEPGEIRKYKDDGSTVAIIVISRKSGENEDVKAEEGGYFLSSEEKN